MFNLTYKLVFVLVLSTLEVGKFQNKALFLTFILQTMVYILIKRQKISAHKVWSKDQVHEKTFPISILTPHFFTISYKMIITNVLL